jgi:hypothetical protein
MKVALRKNIAKPITHMTEPTIVAQPRARYLSDRKDTIMATTCIQSGNMGGEYTSGPTNKSGRERRNRHQLGLSSSVSQTLDDRWRKADEEV